MKNALPYTVVDTKSKKTAQIRKRYIFKLKNIHVNCYTEFHISQEVQQKARFFWEVVYSTYYDKSAIYLFLIWAVFLLLVSTTVYRNAFFMCSFHLIVWKSVFIFFNYGAPLRLLWDKFIC